MRKQIVASMVGMLVVVGSFAGSALSRPTSEAPDAKFTAGSLWTGTAVPDERKAKAKAEAARFKVSTRDTHSFVGVFTQLGRKNKRSLELHGEIGEGGQLKLKPTKVVDGVWGAKVLEKEWTGQVQGESLSFTADGADGESNPQGQKIELTLKR